MNICVILIFIFIFYILVDSSSSLEDFYEKKINEIKKAECDFIGLNGKYICPGGIIHETNKNLLLNNIDITKSCINDENGCLKFQIVDENFNVKINKYDELKIADSYVTYKSTSVFFEKEWINFPSNLDKTIVGFKRKENSPIKFFENFFQDTYRLSFSLYEKLYISEEKSLDSLRSIVLIKPFSDIVADYLPIIYDVDSYGKFVEDFGTHVPIRCSYGGMIEEKAYVKDCIENVVENYTISDGYRSDINWFIDGSVGERPGNPEFVERSKIIEDLIYGGDSNLLNITLRIKSMMDYPVPIKCSYVPIYDVISNSVKKVHLMNYIKEYLEKAFGIIMSDEILEVGDKESVKQLNEDLPISNFIRGCYSLERGTIKCKGLYCCERDPWNYCRCYYSFVFFVGSIHSEWKEMGNVDVKICTPSYFGPPHCIDEVFAIDCEQMKNGKECGCPTI